MLSHSTLSVVTMPKPKEPSDNLGMRQRSLNNKVNEACTNKVKFEDIKEATETSDADKLFKIDVAAKYKNVDYIVEILKGADSLYTTRALKKCTWLFDTEYAHVINPDFLHDHIFPFTSLKMKRKILKAIATHVRNEDRALIFYDFCIKSKLYNLAYKFLLFLPESFKLDFFKDPKPLSVDHLTKNFDYLKQFLGKSLTILSAYLSSISDWTARQKLGQLIFFYKLSNETYLDLVEKHGINHVFDTKISDDIMKKYKHRLLNNPASYIQWMNSDVLVRNSTVEDAKVYAEALLPHSCQDFWYCRFYNKYKYFLELIPHSETYNYIKTIFNNRYPGEEFESTLPFYEQKYYNFMTTEEQELWALNHINSEKQILGVGRDFMWYEFVKFEDAFEAVIKFICITKEPESRTQMVEVLVKAAKSDHDLEKLFAYYKNRHLNEVRPFKERFLNKVTYHHNVYEFRLSCWELFFSLLQSMDIFNTLDKQSHANEDYKTYALLYHIVHEMEIPEPLISYFLKGFEVKNISSHMSKFNDQKRSILYEFLYNFYTTKILEYKYEPFTITAENIVRKYFNSVIKLMQIYNYKAEEVVKHTRKVERKQRYVNHAFSDRELLRQLKKDTELITISFPEVIKRLENKPFKMNTFLKKIKVYFAHDIAKTYLNLFETNITKDLSLRAIDTAVNGIFQLSDEPHKIDFMLKFAPPKNKVIFSEIDPKKLRIQKAICRYMPFSRPPVPQENVLMYMKGDYVPHCLHIFEIYLSYLSLPSCLKFVEAVIDAPVSVQKHGIRLAFQCFNSANLKNLITSIWKRTKNVSLRAVIYKALFNKVKEDKDKELFEALKTFTLDLNQDDEDEIFSMLTQDQLDNEFLWEYNEAAWVAVSQFKNKEPSITRKIIILNCICKNLYLMKDDFVINVVNEHIEEVFSEKIIKFADENDVISRIYSAKWKLVRCYIMYFVHCSDKPDPYVDMTQQILSKCLKSWNVYRSDMLVYQDFCYDFIRELKAESYYNHCCNYEKSIPVIDCIIKELLSKLPIAEVYLLIWELKLTILNKKIIQSAVTKEPDASKRSLDYVYAVDFGKGVGEVIKEYIANGTYYSLFSKDLSEVIKTHIHDMRNTIYGKARFESIQSSIALGLLNEEIPESCVLAVQMLPDQCSDDDVDMFKNIFKILKKVNDPMVQCAMHSKLCSDPKRKRYF